MSYHAKTQSSAKFQAWSPSEVDLLKKAIATSGFNWFEIAKQLPNRSPNQCAQKWKRLNGERSHRQRFWTKEEDDKLKQLVSSLGKRWVQIAKQMQTRNRQQCRERYINLLAPELKGTQYTEEEDELIYKNYLLLGPKWSMIAKMLDGRSGSQVKNRFYSHISKQYLHLKNPYYMRESAEEGRQMLKSIRNHHLSLISETSESDQQNENCCQEYQFKEYFEFSDEMIALYEDGSSSMVFIEDNI